MHVRLMMDTPPNADAVLASATQVQGNPLCLQVLGRRTDIVKLCGTGRPTLIVDNLSDIPACFLQNQTAIHPLKKPVD